MGLDRFCQAREYGVNIGRYEFSYWNIANWNENI